MSEQTPEWVVAQRRELVGFLEGLSTEQWNAPTLCEGWDARDLTAHLVVRERRLDAAPGILIPAFADYTERVQEQVAASTDWDVLVSQVADGPPLYSPFKLLDPIANVAEMFIHHEDVRRARPGWEPRSVDDQTVAALRRPVAMMSRLTLRKAPAKVVLAPRRATRLPPRVAGRHSPSPVTPGSCCCSRLGATKRG